MRDNPINFSQLQYTLAEVAFLGIVPERSVRNWMGRGVIKVGRQNSSARWYFSFLDAVKIRVLGDLCVRLPMLPENSVPLAMFVAKTVAQIAIRDCDRDETGRLVWQRNTNVIAYFDDHGSPCGYHVDSEDIDRRYPPKLTDTPNAPFRRAHIIVPATTTYSDVLYRTEELSEFRARQAEAVSMEAPR